MKLHCNTKILHAYITGSSTEQDLLDFGDRFRAAAALIGNQFPLSYLHFKGLCAAPLLGRSGGAISINTIPLRENFANQEISNYFRLSLNFLSVVTMNSKVLNLLSIPVTSL
jgi:hypothetical protein